MPGQFGSSSKFFAGLLLAGVVALAPSFAQKQSAAPAPAPVVLPGFTVKLTYSQKAIDTLVSRKETVIVAGYLYGFPKKGTPKRYIDEIGQIDLGEIKSEVAPGATAAFDKIEPGQALLKWLDSPGLQLLINVYSGRKSSPNNLLDCGIYEGPLQAVQGKSIPISCKLIGE
ncbi:MAG: hypothetical protein ACLQG3_07525 [Terracidiphilus sp.]